MALSIFKQTKKTREYISGYCLGSGRTTRTVGEQWWPYNTPVWICPTLHRAHQIGAKDDQWHEICRVEGYVHVMARKSGKHGLIYTDEPTRLKITEVHPQFVPPIPESVREARLLKNAAKIATAFHEWMR